MDAASPLLTSQIVVRTCLFLVAGIAMAGGALQFYLGQPDTALVDGDDGEVPGQCRHHLTPRVPVLGPAVHQQ